MKDDGMIFHATALTFSDGIARSMMGVIALS